MEYLITLAILLIIAMALAIAFLYHRDAYHRKSIHSIREDLLVQKINLTNHEKANEKTIQSLTQTNESLIATVTSLSNTIGNLRKDYEDLAKVMGDTLGRTQKQLAEQISKQQKDEVETVQALSKIWKRLDELEGS